MYYVVFFHLVAYMHKSDRIVNNTRHVQAACALRRAILQGQILEKFVFAVFIHVCFCFIFVFGLIS